MDSRYTKQKMIKQKRKQLVIATIVVVVIALAAGLYFWKFRKSSNSENPNPSTTTQKESINYDPPSDQDKQDVNDTKEKLGQDPQQTPTSNNEKKSVTGVITSVYASDDDVHAMAFASGVVENGGQCSFTFTKGSVVITKVISAQADATTTRCESLEFPKSELSSGSWSVIMNYSSASSEGSSNKANLEVK